MNCYDYFCQEQRECEHESAVKDANERIGLWTDEDKLLRLKLNLPVVHTFNGYIETDS